MIKENRERLEQELEITSYFIDEYGLRDEYIEYLTRKSELLKDKGTTIDLLIDEVLEREGYSYESLWLTDEFEDENSPTYEVIASDFFNSIVLAMFEDYETAKLFTQRLLYSNKAYFYDNRYNEDTAMAKV